MTNCQCQRWHRPQPQEDHTHHIWPIADGGPDVPENEVEVCPTAHSNIHRYLRYLRRYGTDMPWSDRRKFAQYHRDLAWAGYAAIGQAKLGEEE